MDEVLGLDRTAQDKRGITGSLLNLGQLALDQGQPRRAAALVEEGLVLARELGDVFRISAAVGLLCLVALAEEDIPQAAMRSKETLELVLQVDSHEARAWTLGLITQAAFLAGDMASECRLFGAAEVLRDAMGAPLYHHIS